MHIKKQSVQERYDDVAVIIPAYNESKNLQILIPRLSEVLPGATVIIVDDSFEIEAKKTNEMQKKMYAVSIVVIHRVGKGGRGSAVMDGMKEALKRKNITACIEMDADLAHNPSECPFLLKGLSKGDMVIGSRYMKGSMIVNWPMQRLIKSKIINAFLNIYLGLSLSDYTNGFRSYSREAMQYLTDITLRERGFILLSEIVFRLKKHGFSVYEIPVSFTDRTFGTSNATTKELLQSLIGAIRIRLP